MEYSICNKGEGFMSVALEKPFARGEEFTAEIATEQRKLQAGGLSAERAYVKAVDAVAAANNMTGEALEKYLDAYRQHLASEKTPTALPVRRRRKNGATNGHNGLSLFTVVEEESEEEPEEAADLEEGEEEETGDQDAALAGLALPNDILLAAPKKKKGKRGGERPLGKILRQMKPGGVCLVTCKTSGDAGSLTGFLSTFSKTAPGWRKAGPKQEGKPAYDTQRVPAYTDEGEPCFVMKIHRHE